MPFQNNSIRFPNGSGSGSGSVADRQMYYETSTRIDQKRQYQWCTDSSDPELFLGKRQAIVPLKVTSGIAILESSLCGGSHFQSESQTPILFSPKPAQSSNVFDDNSIPPIVASKHMGKKDSGNQFGNDPSTCLTMSHAVNCSLSLNSRPRNVKVNEASISENCSPEFVGSTFTHGFSKIDQNVVSVRNSSNKREGNFMLTNPCYNGKDNNVLSIGQPFNRRNCNSNALGEQYEKGNDNFSSICPTYNRAPENVNAVDPLYCNVKYALMSVGSNKGKKPTAFPGQHDSTVALLGELYCKEDSSTLSIVEHSEKGKETAIAFRGFQNYVEEMDRSGRLISGYGVLLNQSAQFSGELGHKNYMDQPGENAILASSSRVDFAPPKNDARITKMRSSKNFPSNVKRLLSTGILDGVPVKYVSRSREKSLRAVVKVSGYLCSCQDCKFAKIVSAYEFEHHAGCKTKHPNNHIYFENGKSIYAVVQELKSTPGEMLFDVIQNVTGSAVNQKNFDSWKASYKIPTREVEHMFGKDDLVAPS